jgi:hypothetical protein
MLLLNVVTGAPPLFEDLNETFWYSDDRLAIPRVTLFFSKAKLEFYTFGDPNFATKKRKILSIFPLVSSAPCPNPTPSPSPTPSQEPLIRQVESQIAQLSCNLEAKEATILQVSNELKLSCLEISKYAQSEEERQQASLALGQQVEICHAREKENEELQSKLRLCKEVRREERERREKFYFSSCRRRSFCHCF